MFYSMTDTIYISFTPLLRILKKAFANMWLNGTTEAVGRIKVPCGVNPVFNVVYMSMGCS